MDTTKSKILFGIFLFGLFITSCGDDFFYKSEVEIPGAKWKSDHVAVFKPEINDTARIFQIDLSVANNNEYRYSNIWFFIKSTSPKGFSHTDTLEVFLAQDDGKWIGKKEGELYNFIFPFRNEVRFPEKGIYTFEILQGMRDLELTGIQKIGFVLKEIQ